MTPAQRGTEALRRVFPGWQGDLTALKTGSSAAVLRATGTPQPVIVKLWPEDQTSKAAAQVTRQSEVADILSSGAFRAPQILAYDSDLRAAVMQDCAGTPLENSLTAEPLPRAEASVEKAGQWLAAFHATSLRQAPFRPLGHVNWLDRLLSEQANGTRHIAELPSFKHKADALKEMFSDVRRRPTLRAITHRDMNAGNLLVDAGGTLWGIDFENAKEDESLRDLFSLAVDLMAFTPIGQDRGACLAALRRGYNDDHTDPVVTLFLQRAFSLGVWARTPERLSQRQAARLRLAHWILLQDTALF